MELVVGKRITTAAHGAPAAVAAECIRPLLDAFPKLLPQLLRIIQAMWVGQAAPLKILGPLNPGRRLGHKGRKEISSTSARAI